MDKYTADNWTKEIEYNHPYLTPDSVVWDIGAYHGAWSAEMHKRYKCQICAYEPVTNFFNDIKKLGIPNVYNYGLGVETTDKTIYLKADSTSFVFPFGDENIAKVVSVRTELAAFHNHVDLASMNIEGMEFELLGYMIGSGLIRSFQHLMVQFHGNDKLAAWIDSGLELTHDPVWQWGITWQLWEIKKQFADNRIVTIA